MINILIVEDESIIARDISRILTKIEGVSTFITDTYESAVEAIDNIIPDLILLDIKLYEDGDAGLRIARYLNSKYRIPFIFLSGYATENYLLKAKQEMPVTFITKPIDSKQLHVAVLMAIKEDQSFKFRDITIHGRKIDGLTEQEINTRVISQTAISSEKINPDNIELIKTFNHVKRNTVLIKFSPNGYFVANHTIGSIMKILPSSFIKVHSSFIVNKNYIKGVIGKNSVKIGNETISFGSQFKKSFGETNLTSATKSGSFETKKTQL